MKQVVRPVAAAPRLIREAAVAILVSPLNQLAGVGCPNIYLGYAPISRRSPSAPPNSRSASLVSHFHIVYGLH